MEYTVLIHTAEEGGYWVEVPALPGCFFQGETLDEALENAHEAIELHLEGSRQQNSTQLSAVSPGSQKAR
ncbi:MAG: type II toxin-antitoxin system HicB family antitoxin [Deltaproteobacteria bacterium]|nr:type II toxin-antitoxin system HicB family antitoxin [Deltaproteobacteria bacterium]